MRLKTEVTLEHINCRTEKAGDKEEGALDLKLTHSALPITKLKGVFPTELGYQTCIERFYREDGELVTELGAFEIAHDGVGVDVAVKSAFGTVLEFTDRANINKFKVKLMPGKVCEFSCRVQLHPSAADVAALWELQGQGVTVSASWKKTSLIEQAEREKQRELDVNSRDEEEGAESATVQ